MLFKQQLDKVNYICMFLAPNQLLNFITFLIGAKSRVVYKFPEHFNLIQNPNHELDAGKYFGRISLLVAML